MRIVSAIVLLLWAVSYGRCLAEQFGARELAKQEWCAQECCQCDEPSAPVPEPTPPCGVCELIKSGVVLPGVFLLPEVRVLDCLAAWEPGCPTGGERFAEQSVNDVMVVDTGPPGVVRLCEWMASTSVPVRGPDAVA